MPKIRHGYNPAAWMLEVTSSAEETRLGVDFAEIYRRSNLHQYVQFPELFVFIQFDGGLPLFFFSSLAHEILMSSFVSDVIGSWLKI